MKMRSLLPRFVPVFVLGVLGVLSVALPLASLSAAPASTYETDASSASAILLASLTPAAPESLSREVSSEQPMALGPNAKATTMAQRARIRFGSITAVVDLLKNWSCNPSSLGNVGDCDGRPRAQRARPLRPVEDTEMGSTAVVENRS